MALREKNILPKNYTKKNIDSNGFQSHFIHLELLKAKPQMGLQHCASALPAHWSRRIGLPTAQHGCIWMIMDALQIKPNRLKQSAVAQTVGFFGQTGQTKI
jgi:hypothetical protein